MDALLFVLLALTTIGASIALVAHRNAVYCALAMVVVFVATAILFLLLEAPFLAALQVIVYAGAIVVLFLFVISYLNLRTDSLVETNRGAVMFAVAAAVLLAVELWVAVATRQPQVAPVTAEGFGSVEHVGEALFSRYIVAFEVTSVLLIVAMVGAVVLAQRVAKRRGEPAGIAETATEVGAVDEVKELSA